MNREINLTEISDGKLYDIDDLVRADASGCGGCSACCHGVGDLVQLNPYDTFEISKALQTNFDALMDEHFVLRPKGKLLFPYLKMLGENEKCVFLSDQGRCVIHEHRPGICRLFPLGRVYDDHGDFKYVLLKKACVKPKLEKVKVEKWLGINDYEANKAFILEWYKLNKALEFRMKFVRDSAEIEAINQYLFDVFYRIEAPTVIDFYRYFYKRLPEAKNHLGIL